MTTGTPPSGQGSSYLDRLAVVLRSGNRPGVRSRGKQSQEIPSRAPVRDRGVRRCVSDHITGRSSGVENGAGIRQSGERRSLIGKDPLTGCTWWGSDCCCCPRCRQTHRAEFAIPSLVRPIYFMSSYASSGLAEGTDQQAMHVDHFEGICASYRMGQTRSRMAHKVSSIKSRTAQEHTCMWTWAAPVQCRYTRILPRCFISQHSRKTPSSINVLSTGSVAPCSRPV